MTEVTLWGLLRKNLKGHFQRIENAVGTGTPDVCGCWSNTDIWIELKTVKGNNMLFQWSQIAWFKKRHEELSTNIWVIARKGTTIYAFKTYSLFEPEDRIKRAVENARVSLKDMEHAVHVWDKPYDWEDIQQTLFAGTPIYNDY